MPNATKPLKFYPNESPKSFQRHDFFQQIYGLLAWACGERLDQNPDGAGDLGPRPLSVAGTSAAVGEYGDLSIRGVFVGITEVQTPCTKGRWCKRTMLPHLKKLPQASGDIRGINEYNSGKTCLNRLDPILKPAEIAHHPVVRSNIQSHHCNSLSWPQIVRSSMILVHPPNPHWPPNCTWNHIGSERPKTRVEAVSLMSVIWCNIISLIYLWWSPNEYPGVNRGNNLPAMLPTWRRFFVRLRWKVPWCHVRPKNFVCRTWVWYWAADTTWRRILQTSRPMATSLIFYAPYGAMENLPFPKMYGQRSAKHTNQKTFL